MPFASPHLLNALCGLVYSTSIVFASVLNKVEVERPRHEVTDGIKVFVSDFLDGFPGPAPSLKDLNLSMDKIYGRPFCTGDPSFLQRESDAPPSFCRYENLQPHLAMPKHEDDDFDQYALERILLAKWLHSPRKCRGPTDYCKRRSDIVVVPSLALHQMLQLGFTWQVKHPSAKAAKEPTRLYWDALRTRFHQPDRNVTPLIVVHSAFAWDWRGYLEILHALAEQPASFVARVVIPSTGSNLKRTERSLFGAAWTDNGHVLIHRYIRGKSVTPGPLLVTMPYPTSILQSVRFTENSGPFSASKARDIAVSFLASAQRNKYGRNWVRELLLEQIEKYNYTNGGHASELQSVRLACREGAAEKGPHCGLGDHPNMWTLTANSAFCLEPAGDTLCRSHFYVAALSGCIPVVIDGGHDEYLAAASTWWAWRRSDAMSIIQDVSFGADAIGEALLDYHKFTVTFNANDIKEGKVDVIKELIEMPTKNPERFHSLRKHLDQVAPLMRYSKERCSEWPWARATPWHCRDAFTAFQAVLANHSHRMKNWHPAAEAFRTHQPTLEVSERDAGDDGI